MNREYVVVYGPPASGKTINKQAIKEHFNCDFVVDDGWQPSELLDGAEGRVLNLMNELPKGEPPHDVVGVHSIDDVAMLLGDKWIEPDPHYRAPRKSDKERFSELLDQYPRLAGFWARSGDPRDWECDIERVRAQGGVLSSGEHIILDCLVSIWLGGLHGAVQDFKIDFTQLATLDRDAREPLLGWLSAPCWP